MSHLIKRDTEGDLCLGAIHRAHHMDRFHLAKICSLSLSTKLRKFSQKVSNNEDRFHLVFLLLLFFSNILCKEEFHLVFFVVVIFSNIFCREEFDLAVPQQALHLLLLRLPLEERHLLLRVDR